MYRILFIIFALCCSIALPRPAAAQDLQSLFHDFRSSELNRTEKRFLQTALAFEGHYIGLLDGDWGPLSQRALDSYARAEFGTVAEEWHMAALAFGFFDLYERDGWGIRHFDILDLSFLYPYRAVASEPGTELFVNWRHTNSSLAYSTGIHGLETVQRLHDYTASTHDSYKEIYELRRRSLAITSAVNRAGGVLYTRSNYVDGKWSTVMISADRQDVPILNAVAASITVGGAPDISIPENGKLSIAIDNVLAVLSQEEEEPQPNVASRPPSDRQFIVISSHSDLGSAVETAKTHEIQFPTVKVYVTQSGFFAVVLGTEQSDRIDRTIRDLVREGSIPPDSYASSGNGFGEMVWRASELTPEDNEAPEPQNHSSVSSGTGFVVSSDGHVLTNAHVVGDCNDPRFNNDSANIVAISDTFDLALLQVEGLSSKDIATFSPTPAKLNSDVTVVGYPLSGILSGVNVTRGAVSSQRGPGGAVTGMQITAPVQPGNSGGPVIGADGEVVGVVVSKLNAQAVSELTGDIPQNVNFAIRGEIAKLFLFQNGVEPELGESDAPLLPTDLAGRATAYTGFIECF